VSIAAPKGADPGPCGLFPLQNTSFRGTAGRGHDRDRGPQARRRRDGGRGPCPRCGSTCARHERADLSIAAPKGRGPRALRPFPYKTPVFGGPPEGAMIAIRGPHARRRRDGGRGRPCPRCASTCSRHERADLSISAPKGHGPRTLRPFSLRGTAGRAMIVIVDPEASRRLYGAPWLQPVAVNGKPAERRSGENKPNPLRSVATGCMRRSIVRRVSPCTGTCFARAG
jgi:hypothetical protein